MLGSGRDRLDWLWNVTVWQARQGLFRIGKVRRVRVRFGKAGLFRLGMFWQGLARLVSARHGMAGGLWFVQDWLDGER